MGGIKSVMGTAEQEALTKAVQAVTQLLKEAGLNGPVSPKKLRKFCRQALALSPRFRTSLDLYDAGPSLTEEAWNCVGTDLLRKSKAKEDYIVLWQLDLKAIISRDRALRCSRCGETSCVEPFKGSPKEIKGGPGVKEDLPDQVTRSLAPAVAVEAPAPLEVIPAVQAAEAPNSVETAVSIEAAGEIETPSERVIARGFQEASRQSEFFKDTGWALGGTIAFPVLTSNRRGDGNPQFVPLPFTTVREKVQTEVPFKYLGHQLTRAYSVPKRPEFSIPDPLTYVGLQKILGDVNWVRPYVTLPTEFLAPLYSALRGHTEPGVRILLARE